MNLTWLKSLILGAITGLTEILPVSSEAHTRTLMKLMGLDQLLPVTELLIHLAVLAALVLSCHPHILKMARAKSLSRIPKSKRKRPLDVRSMMDLSLLMTMLLPVLLALFAYRYISGLEFNNVLLATFLFLNGLLLYIPQYLPSSNKDCRSLSRVEGILMGLGGALFVLPGFSGVGAALSLASIAGVDRKYALNMVLLMHIGVMAGRVIMDLLSMFSVGFAFYTFVLVLISLLGALTAFAAAYFAIKLMRALAQEKGYGLFSTYCWGLALLTFILTLIA